MSMNTLDELFERFDKIKDTINNPKFKEHLIKFSGKPKDQIDIFMANIEKLKIERPIKGYYLEKDITKQSVTINIDLCKEKCPLLLLNHVTDHKFDSKIYFKIKNIDKYDCIKCVNDTSSYILEYLWFFEDDKKKSCYLYSNNKLYKLFEFQNDESVKKQKRSIDHLKTYLSNGEFKQSLVHDTSEQQQYNHFFDYYIELFLVQSTIDKRIYNFILNLINFEEVIINAETPYEIFLQQYNTLIYNYRKLGLGYIDLSKIVEPYYEKKIKKDFDKKIKIHSEQDLHGSPIKNENIFNDLNIKLNLNLDFKYLQQKQQISEINEIRKKFISNPTFKDGLELMERLIKYIKLYDSLNNNTVNRLLNILIKIPLQLYNILSSDLTISIDDQIIISELFGNWMTICSSSPLINIYKYSYLLLINKILKPELEQIGQIKKYILDEFILDLNSCPLSNLSLLTEIEQIKTGLGDIKIWYWDTESYSYIYDKIVNMYKEFNQIKGNLTTDHLSKHNTFLSRVQSETIKFNFYDEGYISDSNKLNIIKLEIDNLTFCFRFPDFRLIGENPYEKILTFLQIINSCKLENPSDCKYPYELPYNHNLEMTIIYNYNYIYTTCLEIKNKSTSQYIKPFHNEYNTLPQDDIKYNYLNHFINYLETKEPKYLKEIINPFLYLGLQVNNGSEEYVNIEYDSKNIKGSSLKLKNNLFELLKIKNDLSSTPDYTLLETLDKMSANQYIFIYSYLSLYNKSKELFENEVIGKKIYSHKAIQNESDKRIQLILLSNRIKYLTINNITDSDLLISLEYFLELTKTETEILFDKLKSNISSKLHKIKILGLKYIIPYIQFKYNNKCTPETFIDGIIKPFCKSTTFEQIYYNELWTGLKFNDWTQTIIGKNQFIELINLFSFKPRENNLSSRFKLSIKKDECLFKSYVKQDSEKSTTDYINMPLSFYIVYDDHESNGLDTKEERQKFDEICETNPKLFRPKMQTKFKFKDIKKIIKESHPLITSYFNIICTEISKKSGLLEERKKLIKKIFDNQQTIRKKREDNEDLLRQQTTDYLVKIRKNNVEISNLESKSEENKSELDVIEHKIQQIDETDLDKYLINIINPIEIDLPIYTDQRKSESPDFSFFDIVKSNLYNFLSNYEEIHADYIFNCKKQFNDCVQEYNDYNLHIRKVYVSDLVRDHRTIYIKGKDMFQQYDKLDLIGINNKSPYIDDRQDYRNELRVPEEGKRQIKKQIIKEKDELRYDLNKLPEGFEYDEKDYLTEINEFRKKDLILDKNMIQLSFNGKEISFIVNNLKEINDMVFKGTIDIYGNIIFNKPYYLDNPIFCDDEYFIFDAPPMFTSGPRNEYYKNIKLELRGDQIIKNGLYTYTNINNLQNGFLDIILLCIDDKRKILCWINRVGQLYEIDILSEENKTINFKFDKDVITMNNRLGIILNLDNVNLFIKKWILSEKVLLSIDADQNYFLIILEKKYFLKQVKLNKNTYLPIITNIDVLNMLCEVYKDYSLILKELVPLICKYNLKIDNYYVRHYQQKLPSVTETNYYIKYNLLKIINFDSIDGCEIEKDIIMFEDEYMKNYYTLTNGLSYVSYGEFMMSSLITDSPLRNLAFTLFYYKLVYKLIIDRKLIIDGKEKYHPPLDPDTDGYFILNPLEFYYQYIFGSFARPEQNELSNNIFKDIVKKYNPDMTGGFDYKMSNYNRIKKTEYKHRRDDDFPQIHNLIMGGGKTSMITPLVILKYLQYLTIESEKLKQKQNCYIVLPEKLVEQSLTKLLELLHLYFPINIKEIKEDRHANKEYTSSLIFDSDDNLNVYIMSDTSLKCGFINNYPLVLKNRDNHVYLFDEADTILNSSTSELNYPKGETKIELIKEVFDLFYEIYVKIYVKPDETLNSILKKYPDSYGLEPHFNIIDYRPDFIDELKTWVREYIATYYRGDPKLSKLIRNDFTETILDSVSDLDKLNLLYIIYNFLNNVFTVTLTMIDRTNFGLEFYKTDTPARTRVTNFLAIPFSYNDDPCIGSKFSNPLLTLCLTIISYITKNKLLDNQVVVNMIQIIISEYGNTDNLFINTLPIYIEYQRAQISIPIQDLSSIKDLDDKDINKFKENDYFRYRFCKKICYDQIQIELERDNISGVDLFLSQNIANRSGFTGTPNIPTIYDRDKTNQIMIRRPSEESTTKIKEVLDKCEIYKYDDTDYQNNIKKIMSERSNVNVIIDIGGVLVNISPLEIYQIIKEIHPHDFKQFIYWDDKDKPISIDINNNSEDWNRNVNDGMFFYYDHKHTTGIDAEIKERSVAIAFLGKSSKYRDVVQGIYRMRKLNLPEDRRHQVIFMVSDKIDKLIKNTLKMSQEDLNSRKIQEWFSHNEKMSFQQQQYLFNLQNIKGRYRYIELNFNDKNNFRLFKEFIPRQTQTEIILGKTTYHDIDIDVKIKMIDDKELLGEYLKNKNLGISSSTSEQSSTQVLALEIERSAEKEKEQEKRPVPRSYERKIFHNFSIDEYFKANEHYKEIIKDHIYESINFSLYSENDKYPAHVIYIKNQLFIIPNVEGFKIIDYIDSHSDLDLPIRKEDFIILDSSGVIYYTNGLDMDRPKVVDLIKSYVRIILRYDVMNILTMDDYINFIKYLDMKGFNSAILAHLAQIESDLFERYIEAINHYFTMIKTGEQLIDQPEKNKFYNFFTNNGHTLQYLERFKGETGSFKKYIKYKQKYLKLKNKIIFS